MSAVPPSSISSILQSPHAQRQVTAARDADEARKAAEQRQQVFAIDNKDSTVETGDNDTQIYSDAEGTGSQGRAFGGDDQPTDDSAVAPDLTDEDGHIDVAV